MLGRALAWLVSLAVLAAVAVALRDRWSDVRDAGGLPGALPVLASVVIHVAGNGVLVATWRELTALRGHRLPWPAAAWVWATSQLTRYGLSGAQVAGRAVLARRYGSTALAGGVTALVEVAWQAAILGLLLLATVPWWLPAAEGLSGIAIAGALPAAILVVGSVAPERLLRGIARVAAWGPLRRATRGRLVAGVTGLELRRRDAARLTAWFVATTALRLAAFGILLSAVGGDLPADLPAAIGAYAAGQLAGRLAFFAPGGLGPQEGVTALVLAPVLGGPGALVLVASVRGAELAGELVFLGLARLRRPAPVSPPGPG